MHATVKPLRCLPLLATWLVCLAVAAAEARGDEAVRMEPYYVDGSVSDLRLRVRHDPATKKITVMQIVRVGPSLEKSGIRVGDRVTAINDKTVSAMTVGEFEALTVREMSPSSGCVFPSSGAFCESKSIFRSSSGSGKSRHRHPPLPCPSDPQPCNPCSLKGERLGGRNGAAAPPEALRKEFSRVGTDRTFTHSRPSGWGWVQWR